MSFLAPRKNFYIVLPVFIGQNYVFDVQHTWREVYDSTRRKLMKEAANQNSSPTEEQMEVSEINSLHKSHECPDVQVRPIPLSLDVPIH